MEEMIALLKFHGYKKASLSVNKENYASEMYRKLGFLAVPREHDGERQEEDDLMVLELQGGAEL